MATKVTITNEEQLYRKLRTIPEAYRRKIREALGNEADEIVDFMRRMAPVESGDLRDSIGWRWGSRAPKGSISLGGAKVPTEGGAIVLTIYAGGKVAGGGDAFYARFIEFGTRKMTARPFFFPAYRARRKEARRAVGNAVRRAGREVAASG